MNRGYKSECDLEKCVQSYEEDEIRLLEDTPAGKWIYFFSWYFFGKIWIFNTVFPLFGTCLGTSIRAFYFFLGDIFIDRPETTFSKILSPPWMFTHYLLYFTVCFVSLSYGRKNVYIEKKELQKLLEDIAGMDLTGDGAAWRKIADSVNCFFKQEGYRYAFFYSEEQCRCFFLKEVLKPIESGSYEIKTYWNHEACMDYCKDSSNKKLAERAVANYQKSIESFSESTPLDERGICTGFIFGSLPDSMSRITIYLMMLEFAVLWVLCLVLIVLRLIY